MTSGNLGNNLGRTAAVLLLTVGATGCQLANLTQFADMEFWVADRRGQAEGEAPPPQVAEPVHYASVPAKRVPNAAPTPQVIEVPVYVPAPRTFFDVEAERQSGAKRIARQRRGARIHDPRAAVRTAVEGRFLNASLLQPFIDNMIYEVIVQVARITTIRLEPGEQITSLEASDSATIQLATSQVGSGGSLAHVIVLKPNDLFETNNLQIVTTRRLYLIDLVMADPGSEAYHRLVTWTYPTLHLPLPATPQPQHAQSHYAESQSAQSHFAQPASPQPPAAPPVGYQGEMMQVASVSTESAPRPTRLWDLNFGYVIDGRDVPWKPLSVYDDGAKTVIRFAPEVLARKAPALFVIDLDDQVEAVNYRVRGASYVVDGLFDRAALQLGQDPDAIVMIARSGIWNDPRTAQVREITTDPREVR
ncbi:TrbG/VirB9 family P-type conjugative transfer protein [Thalassobaculum sp.]|uniref:TrbG/VirB9 family P-type conjugative transfer protein n=1 Tax=Thalassobaculum sp. TaxID=2022740 RepID=UPI0032EAAE01